MVCIYAEHSPLTSDHLNFRCCFLCSPYPAGRRKEKIHSHWRVCKGQTFEKGADIKTEVVWNAYFEGIVGGGHIF